MKYDIINLGGKMKLLFATGNQFKYNLMKERLKELTDIEIVIPKMLDININVVENGTTASENATLKAKAYYEATKLPTIAEDSGLFIDEFDENEQPGLFVKRVNGKEDLSDEEILNYYIDKLNEHGGKSLANYYTGVCLIDEDGNVFSDTIYETKFLLTTEKNEEEKINGGILESISYDINAQKYFSQRNEQDEKNHYKELDEKYRNLVRKYILKEKINS